MTDAHVPAHAMFKVLAALAELGDATAAAVADKAELGYSTATAKLRAWEQTGQAERIHTDSKRAVWRLTDAGRATVGAGQAESAAHDSAPDVLPGEPAPTTSDDDPAEVADTTRSTVEAPTPAPESPAHGESSTSVGDTAAPPDAPPPPDGEEEPAPSSDGGREQAAPAPDDSEPDAGGEPGDEATSTGRDRRPKGSLRAAVLDILEAHPDRAYKTSELCKLIDAADAGAGVKKARPGAVVNAAVKLVADGKAVQTVEKPATFQLAPTTGSR